tara:strand:+ start:1726 stop:2310 length:585 start_codon:yes stop_codon:yes gene_type:complete
MNHCSIKKFITDKERDVLVKYFKDEIERGDYATGSDVCKFYKPEWFVINNDVHGHHMYVDHILERINNYFSDTENCVNGEREHQPIICVVPPGAEVEAHIDRFNVFKIWSGELDEDAPDDKAITKFIAFINKPDNSSKFYIDNVEIETEETELIIFEPSEKVHEVTKNLSQDHVIILIFARITDISDQWFKSIQ